MIRHHLKDSLHWLHLYCFRQQAFDWKVDEHRFHSRWERLAVVLKLYPWFFLAGLLLLAMIGISCEFVGISFNWPRAFGGAILGGLGIGLFGVWFGWEWGGPLGGLVGSLFGGLSASLGGIWAGGLSIGLAGGLFFGTFYALISWSSPGLKADLSNVGKSGRFVTYLFGIILGLLVLLFAGLGDTILFALSFYPMAFLTSVFFIKRPYYRSLHSVQFLRAHKDKQWLTHFRNSPTHWDETIGTQLPFLSDWLFEIAKGSEEGLKEVIWVAAKRPFQRKSAQEALERLAVQRLTEIDSIFGLQRVTEAIDFLPTDNLLFPMIDENGKPFFKDDKEKPPPDTFRLIPSSFYMARPSVRDKTAISVMD